jgi:hypothetical protein
MIQVRRLAFAALVLGVGQLLSSKASAGHFWDWLTQPPCPSPTYSPFRYWTPSAAHFYDDTHGPMYAPRAPLTHPEIPPTYTVLKYKRRCPAQEPAATVVPVPIPPATSKAS